MVWAGVFLHHKPYIVLIKGKLTTARYQHKVLDTEVIQFLRNHRGMQLLHHGAPAHLARVTIAYLNANNVNVVDPPPPPYSPDFNIIENIWDKLNRGVRRTGAIPTTLNQLRAKILYKWNSFPQKYVQRYVTSMRRRCLAEIEQCGGTCPLLSLHGHGRQYRIYLKNIVIFTLFFDIFDQVWSLL